MDEMGALLFLAGGFDVFSIYSQTEAQKEAIEAEEREVKAAFDQKQIVQDKKIQQIIGLQTVKAATTGFKYTGNFAELALKNFQEFADDRQAALLNYHWKIAQLKQEKDNAIAGGISKGLTEVGEAATEIYGLHDMKNPEVMQQYSKTNPFRFYNEELYG